MVLSRNSEYAGVVQGRRSFRAISPAVISAIKRPSTFSGGIFSMSSPVILFSPSAAVSDESRLYAATAEEYCNSLLNQAEKALNNNDLAQAMHHLKLQTYFAKTALGSQHPLNDAGERAILAIQLYSSAELAKYILEVARRQATEMSQATQSCEEPALVT